MKWMVTATLPLALLSVCCSCALARAESTPDAVGVCDRTAGDRYDADLRPGTELAQPQGIDAAVALPACRVAAAANPDDRRIRYQYGRALMSAGSRDEAEPWLERAAMAGSGAAMSALGRWYELRNGPADLATAREWYRKGVSLGDVSSMLNMGILYERGSGVDRDNETARHWYERAFAAGDDRAALRLGFLYESGTSTLKDVAAARRWYRKSADAGNVVAMVNLGRMCSQGLGGEKDIEAARSAYAAAAAKGDRLAKTRLEELRKE